MLSTELSAEITQKEFDDIEKFTIYCYVKPCDRENVTTVNSARKLLFQKSIALDRLPPTQAALHQHCLRARLQAIIWRNALIKEIPVLNPLEYGWKLDKNNLFTPLWTMFKRADEVSDNLTKCGCKSGCKNQSCSCRKKSLKCTGLQVLTE